MKLKQIIIGVLLAIVALLGGDYASTKLGSNWNESNMSTTTDQFGSVSVGSSRQLKVGSGVLTGFVITNETAGSFNLYDATSTKHGDHATTTLIKVYASLAEGQYTDLNIGFSRGLLLEHQSTNIASGTVLWK